MTGMRLALGVLLSCGLLASAACDSAGGSGAAGLAFHPSSPAALHMTPTGGPLNFTPAVCSAGRFTPSLTLVINGPQPFNASIDTVSFHLIDGSAGGGPSITFPRPQLTELFGTTIIVGSRSFPFAPAFACPAASTGALAADVILDDGQHLTATLALR